MRIFPDLCAFDSGIFRIFALRTFQPLAIGIRHLRRWSQSVKSAIGISYLQSLAWVVLFVGMTMSVSLIVHLVFFDFIHGNPHRTSKDVINMIAFQVPLMGAIAATGAFLVFTLPQIFQAAAIVILNWMFGNHARFAVFQILPITAVLTWYCYDYLTPSWIEYEHGISGSRYLATLVFQTAATLFSVLHFEAGFRGISKKPMLAATLAIALMAGGFWGYGTAQDQIRLQSTTTPPA